MSKVKYQRKKVVIRGFPTEESISTEETNSLLKRGVLVFMLEAIDLHQLINAVSKALNHPKRPYLNFELIDSEGNVVEVKRDLVIAKNFLTS
ncbi:MAG: hypothetical protein UU77_C0013G0006 [candidate division WWE3 bacterium GW2011_GWC1_41_7]|uniref:Uncharacterized protein n=4 Tax=Katanobacteria TaxID=422282 RepID=A0A0G0XBV7_UNCKA|nr:MAG: hypothetical protein UU72_C0019G0006 [candidate division WWE3 bacterium GW2011_GWB1_41_6]KKS20891.1 MAG: hypothetical protein UU77_C0013G0006 [candidate division WWE3 bacterium GW2011_GWC1_41_7]KKS21872.1 MAG: hypothetical protein UU80_C0018G0008 [candidate division WWE3 bacterium GW2011_GWA1_41_8]OGC57900.1 MAG: hypothetical protein A2976_00300 [candidate division WWE3 bacterium RIFCSPLOWO2_01_FULL_41_9]HLC93859.1 hypothetical protein [Patescibacteria group bacterium]